MSSKINDPRENRDRKIKQDTRAWATFTGTNYTSALRQVESPLAQGFLDERISARHLINTLEDHLLVGADGGDFILGEAGYYADTAWNFNQTTDFVELALLVDFLRMFTPLNEDEEPRVGSYALKHTAEEFLAPHYSSVTNGRLIWAAAALGLPMVEERDGLNLLIGISETEHDYVRRMVLLGQPKPQGHHHRPAGMTHLKTVLEQCAAGEPVLDRWERPAPSTEVFLFHEWLIQQAGRDDLVGDVTADYAAGVRDSYHRIARSPQELLDIMNEVPSSFEARAAAMSAVQAWAEVAPADQRATLSIRTERISDTTNHNPGWGAGAGSIEVYTYQCPCGDGEVIEEHDNIPGFRERGVQLYCDKCLSDWRFVKDLGVRNWRLEPVTAGEAG